MGYIRVCDLCGKPMRETGKTYRIKELRHSWHESGWTTIEAHDECVKRVLNALDDKRDRGGRVMLTDLCFKCSNEGSILCTTCGIAKDGAREHFKQKPLTNADRVRAMDIDHLIEWYCWGKRCERCPYNDVECRIRDWLQQEAD